MYIRCLLYVVLLISVQGFSQDISILSEHTMIFPGCEGSEVQLKKCFLKNVQLHIAKNFDADLPNQLGLKPGKKRGFVMFTITKEGVISNIKVRAAHPDLVEECKRVFRSFPKVIPKKIDGIPLETQYSTPFYLFVKTPETILKNLVSGDKSPIYKGCNGNMVALKKCFSINIQKHFKNNFKNNNSLGLAIGNYKVDINFTITKEGNTKYGDVFNRSIKSINVNVINQLKQIVKSLPKFTPGTSKGKLVDVVCSIPFKFYVTKNSELVLNNKSKPVSFMVIEDVPIFPGCKGSKKGLKKCFSKKVQLHFSKFFDADLPNRLGLTPGKKRVLISFWIKNDGYVANIKVKAPHNDIKEEIIYVMKKLPRFIPGKQNGKPVGVRYAIPFTLVVGKSKKKEDPFKGMSKRNNGW